MQVRSHDLTTIYGSYEGNIVVQPIKQIETNGSVSGTLGESKRNSVAKNAWIKCDMKDATAVELACIKIMHV